VIGSMISLGYYLPVIAAIWMRDARKDDARPAGDLSFPANPLPAIAGGSPELDAQADSGADTATASSDARTRAPQFEVVLVAILAGGATLFFGIVPQPLFDLVQHAGRGFGLF
jgi:NADH-quinone oxidoreductase subunit N